MGLMHTEVALSSKHRVAALMVRQLMIEKQLRLTCPIQYHSVAAVLQRLVPAIMEFYLEVMLTILATYVKLHLVNLETKLFLAETVLTHLKPKPFPMAAIVFNRLEFALMEH